MNEEYKEVVIPNCVEVIYTISRTYERYDGEVVAECKMVANNITPNSIVKNDCGICDGIALSTLKKLVDGDERLGGKLIELNDYE